MFPVICFTEKKKNSRIEFYSRIKQTKTKRNEGALWIQHKKRVALTQEETDMVFSVYKGRICVCKHQRYIQ